jgi:hypothetical protein
LGRVYRKPSRMTILTYIGVSLVILVLCGLGLSIGLLFNRRGLTKCGQGEGAHADKDITCPACENRGSCKKL